MSVEDEGRVSALNRATEIAAELERSSQWRSRGEIATAVMAAVAAVIPIAGGPASVVIDKLGEKLTSANLEGKLVELCRLIGDLEPEVAKISALEDRVATILAVISTNQALAARLDGIVASLGDQKEAPTFWVESLGGSQTFRNVRIREMLVLAEAHNGAVNYFRNVRTKGPGVHFRSSVGGYQHVENSTFEGSEGSIGMNGISIEGPISIDPRGRSISFRGNSSLTFRGPRRHGRT